MQGIFVEAMHATARLKRPEVFSDDLLMPVTALIDANTASPGWVGSDWQPGGTLLVGINPGGGGDAYRGNPTDTSLYRLIRAFRDAPEPKRAAALAALSEAWIAIQAAHNIRRVVDAVFEATSSKARNAAFINMVPFRTRNDAAPRKGDLLRAWQAAVGAQVAALAPRRIIALGKKAHDGLVAVQAVEAYEVVLIKRAIGDSTITAEAQETLARLRKAASTRVSDGERLSPVVRSAPTAVPQGQPNATFQMRASATTRYQAIRRPNEQDGYVQRIPMWDAVQRLGSCNRSELLTELRRTGYARPNGAPVDEAYCRVELTDMTKRGYLARTPE